MRNQPPLIALTVGFLFITTFSSAQVIDCAGVANGTALEDECGVCQQAYIYNFITHAVVFVDNAN